MIFNTGSLFFLRFTVHNGIYIHLAFGRGNRMGIEGGWARI